MSAASAPPVESSRVACPPASSLHRDWVLLFLANSGYAGGQWLMIVLVARLLSPEYVGHYTLALAITTPLFMLFNLSLRVVESRDVAFVHGFTDYLTLRVVTSVLALFATAAVCGIKGLPAAVALAVLLVACTKGADGTGEICYSHYQRRGCVDRIARSLLLRVPLGLIAFTGALLARRDLNLALLAFVLGQLAIVGLVDLRAAPRLDRTFGSARCTSRELLAMARFALPLGVIWALNAVAANAPRIFLSDVAGAHMLGIFSAITNLTVLVSYACVALGEVSIPRWSAHYQRGDLRAFRRLLRSSIGIGFLISAAALLACCTLGDSLLRLLYGEVFGGYQRDLIIVMVGTAFCGAGSFLSCALYACGGYQRILLPYVVSTALTVVASRILIGRFGLPGASASMVVIGFMSSAVAVYGLLQNRAIQPGQPRGA